jgi:Family of unknown function (DUF5686)/CarboxypepD_reg-like domain
MKKLILFLGFVFSATLASAQMTIISGKITDSENGDPIPFANVRLKGTNIGTATDFDGVYLIKTDSPTDSLVVSAVGYITKAKLVQKRKTQSLNFQLATDVKTLREVVITGEYENPAWEILRKVMENKKRNDASHFEACEFERYNRVEIDVDNINREEGKKKGMKQQLLQALDSMEKIVGEDGKLILPIYISETLSNIYARRNPNKNLEHILKNKVHGVGFTDDHILTQIIAAFFQEYNFYDDWLIIGNKNLISPIADSWKGYYEYTLDTAEYPKIDKDVCYRITFKPKREQDLAFSGTIWIADSSFALRRIEVTLGQSANLNFIDKIKIQQELQRVGENEGYLVAKSRVMLDLGQMGDNWMSLLAKFYTSNKKFIINKPRPTEFYADQQKVEEDAYIEDSVFWSQKRHDSLSNEEKQARFMIESRHGWK